jgi:membrane associated rhomboid family serine protease
MFQSIPTVTKNLLIINVLAYLATQVLEMRGIDLTIMGGLHYLESPYFHFYQFLTYQFLHGSLSHIFFNMFALWMFGCVIERVWGPKKYLIYYMICGIGAGLCQELVQFLMGSYSVTIGASGAVYAILLAFGMTFPEERMFIFPFPIPIKAKWFVIGYAALELFLALGSAGDGVAHMAHLGGMLFGFLLIRYWRSHPSIDFDMNGGRQFMDRMFSSFEQRTRRNQQQQPRQQQRREPTPPRGETDMEYNARKQKKQAEIDRILDKIRQSGYDSLTKAEKQFLFDASRDK